MILWHPLAFFHSQRNKINRLKNIKNTVEKIKLSRKVKEKLKCSKTRKKAEER